MEQDVKLRALGEDFGVGRYVSWKDGDTKKVLISNWGVYDKPDDEGKLKLAFRCDVLEIDGKMFSKGQKVIDTTSINFHKAIKPLLNGKLEKAYLEITRIGEKQKTAFVMKLI